jgi:tetratricopeptide (TPR) repeat protein
LPATPALRREQIKLQVALITPLIHIKGYSAPETKAAAERAHLLIEQAERLGEPPEDPLLLFSVLYGFWYANLGAFNGDALCDLAAQFLALAEKQRATVPLMVGHRLVGSSSLHTGDFVDSRAHFDQALSLYDFDKHRSLATWHGQDIRVSILSFRSITLWMFGYPQAALTDVDQAVKHARESGHAPSLIYALAATSVSQLLVGDYASVNAQTDEAIAIAQEKGEVFWKAWGRILQGCVLDLTGKGSEAVQQITSGIAAYQSTGATVWLRQGLTYLAKTCADLGQFDDAWRSISEAIDTSFPKPNTVNGTPRSDTDKNLPAAESCPPAKRPTARNSFRSATSRRRNPPLLTDASAAEFNITGAGAIIFLRLATVPQLAVKALATHAPHPRRIPRPSGCRC